jgi:hypothetical protein
MGGRGNPHATKSLKTFSTDRDGLANTDLPADLGLVPSAGLHQFERSSLFMNAYRMVAKTGFG